MDFFNILFAKQTGLADGSLESLFGRLIGEKYVWETEKAPYFFRRSGGSLRSRLLGKEKDCIVGVSVPWNQLAPTYSSAVSTLMPFIEGTTIVAGHKYYISRKLSVSESVGNFIYARVNGANVSTQLSLTGTTKEGIKTAAYGGVSDGTTANTEGNIWIYQGASESATVSDIQLIDLTLMFGSTIADYAYTLETQQSGKGIAWLKSYGFFGEPYYAYDSGSIKSVSGLVSHNMTGKNQFNEPSNYNGDLVAVHIDANQSFVASANISCGIRYYDADQVQIDYWSTLPNSYGDRKYRVITANKDIEYIAFYGSGNPKEFMIEFGSTVSDYAPYTVNEYALDSDLILRGVPKMDADHNLYADGDTYESSGVVTRKYLPISITRVSNKSGTWDSGAGKGAFWYTTLTDLSLPAIKALNTAFMKGYALVPNVTDNLVVSEPTMAMFANGIIRWIDPVHMTDDKDTYNAYLANNPIEGVLEVLTPTTDTAEPFASPQKVDGAGTEQYITTDSFVPVGHETQYKCSPTP